MEIRLLKGDITRQEVDVIVNAANTGLRGGGGVDGAIHRVGGPSIMAACDRIREERGGIRTGEVVETTAGNLPARFVFHTAGPVWQGGQQQEAELLRACYRNSLALAETLNCKSIALPNISTGVYGFPKAEAARIALESIRSHREIAWHVQEVRLLCFDEENYRLYLDLLAGKAEE